jgi:hypothetical protein
MSRRIEPGMIAELFESQAQCFSTFLRRSVFKRVSRQKVKQVGMARFVFRQARSIARDFVSIDLGYDGREDVFGKNVA